MKAFLIITSLFLISNLTFAQYDVNVMGNADQMNSNSGMWVLQDGANTQTDGNYYLIENWESYGVIRTKDNKNLAIKGLNYDTEKDAFVAKVSKDSMYIFNNTNIKEVKINNRKFRLYNNVENGMDCNLEVLASNKNVEILKMNKKKIILGKLNPLTQVKTPDKYIDNARYFFKSNDRIKEFKLKKKSFYNLFGEHSKKINKFMSENSISLKDQRKLVAVLKYYNSL